MNYRLEKFLKLVVKYPAPRKERTIFSLGGRGYYENATSDMLAFFLRPDAEHGFGTLFLSAFFDCMSVNDGIIPELTRITVEREIKTSQGNRIDLQIIGADWCLIIENKIRYKVNNPFADYINHAKTLCRKQTFFAILAPHREISQPGWIGISYARYCATLRDCLGKALFDAPHSKWHLFAREFILHIENELYTPTMNPKEVAFVEDHTPEITETQKLMLQYHAFVRQEIQTVMGKKFPEFTVQVCENFWSGQVIVFRCTSSQWNRNDMVIFKPEGEGQKYSTRIYVDGASEARLAKAKLLLEQKATLTPNDGGFSFWTFPGTHSSATKAIAELCACVELVKPVLTM